MKSFETFFTLCSPEDDSDFTDGSNWGMDEDENSEEGDVEEEEQDVLKNNNTARDTLIYILKE